jgi:hypothetical protein
LPDHFKDPNSPGVFLLHIRHLEIFIDLRDFVYDLITGVYGDADIVSIEVGNEYWGSGGMNAVEYGHIAAEMAFVIHDELVLINQELGIDTSGCRGPYSGRTQLWNVPNFE